MPKSRNKRKNKKRNLLRKENERNRINNISRKERPMNDDAFSRINLSFMEFVLRNY